MGKVARVLVRPEGEGNGATAKGAEGVRRRPVLGKKGRGKGKAEVATCLRALWVGAKASRRDEGGFYSRVERCSAIWPWRLADGGERLAQRGAHGRAGRGSATRREPTSTFNGATTGSANGRVGRR